MAGDIRQEISELKKEVRELKPLGADKVLVSTLEDLRAATVNLHRRVTNLEMFLSKSAGAGASVAGGVEAGN